MTSTQGRWQRELADGISQPEILLKHLELTVNDIPFLQANSRFALRVPLSFVKRMRKGDPGDPLLRQVLPLKIEDEHYQNYVSDPLLEQSQMPVPGLIHKYHGRVLVITTPSCPINCRYCFRRHFPYREHSLTPSIWQNILKYISNDSSIKEVIFSGGEPLLLPNKIWEMYLSDVCAVSHIKLIRVHSRMPIVLPQRMERALLDVWKNSPCPLTLVLHSNHPNEINNEVAKALQPFKQQGITLMNQSVLLKGINDCAHTLAALSYQLMAAGILPYYLHFLDSVQGSQHFFVPKVDAQHLMQKITKELPGYLVPKLVQDNPQHLSKQWIDF